MIWTFTPDSPLPHAPTGRRGFDKVPFGPLQRLVWAKGAIEIDDQGIAYWGERYAVIADPKSLRVVDLERADVTRIRGLEPLEVAIVGDLVCVELAEGLLWIPCTDLARYAAGDHGSDEVTVEIGYPERIPDASVEAKVAWVLATDALVNIATVPVPTQIRMPHAELGLTKGLRFHLTDQLWPGRYATIAIPGRAPHAWFPIATGQRTMHVTWAHEEARDPAAGSTTFIADARIDARIDALLADRPDDLDARAILIDVLGDAGEACAETFALLAAGKRVPAARKLDALGPLAHVLDDVEFRGGLPWAAIVAKKPPTDRAVIAAAARDVRLAMLETFRRGRGPEEVYRTLLVTRMLTSLRRVDASSVAALRALRATGYTRLVELWNVPSGKVALGLLADPAFAQVRTIQFQLDSRDARRLPELGTQLRALPAAPREIAFMTAPVYIAPLLRAFVPSFADLGVRSLAIYARPSSHLTVTSAGIAAGERADPAHLALARSLVRE